MSNNTKDKINRLISDYGMLGVLILLCLLFSVLTMREQHPTGSIAAKKILVQMRGRNLPANILVITQQNEQDRSFAQNLESGLDVRGKIIILQGGPSEIRSTLEGLADSLLIDAAIMTTESYAPTIRSIIPQFPLLSTAAVVTPPSYRWPTFLLSDNLRNVANQI